MQLELTNWSEQSTPSPDEDQQEAAETSRSTPQVITSWDTIIKMKVFFKYVRIPLFWLGGGGEGGEVLIWRKALYREGRLFSFFFKRYCNFMWLSLK